MSISINACGRSPIDPQKSDLDNRIERDKRLRADTRAELKLPSSSQPPLVESVCSSYYASQDVGQINAGCRACIERTAENDIDCSCVWDKNFCKYATCVADEFKKNKSCANSFQTIFNTDDFKDDNYRAEITPSQLKHCEIFADEHYDAKENNTIQNTLTQSQYKDNSGIWTVVILVSFLLGSFMVMRIFKKYRDKKKSILSEYNSP
jgi:hypothetical protein